MLEDQLGEKLFQRSGRNLVLTDMGRVVYRYADDIFSLGRELMDTLKDRPTGRPMRFQVGVADEVTKIIAYRLLEPAMRLAAAGADRLPRRRRRSACSTDLATHALDLVIADTPIVADDQGQGVQPRARRNAGHGLRDRRSSRRSAQARFPRSLDGAPFLLPTERQDPAAHARSIFRCSRAIRPRIVAELDDSALLTTFGQAGAGLFVAPTVLEKEVMRQFGVTIVGRLDEVRERYFAISVERRLKHPAVVAISEAANELLLPPKPRTARKKSAAASVDN